MINYFDVLGISENAAEREIRTAYHKMAMRFHPDVSDLPEKEAEAKMRLVNEAYGVLNDAERRARHIHELHTAYRWSGGCTESQPGHEDSSRAQSPDNDSKEPQVQPETSLERLSEKIGELLGMLILLFLLGALICSIIYYVPGTIMHTLDNLRQEFEAILQTFA